MENKKLNYGGALNFDEACARLPSDLYEYLAHRMSQILTQRELQVLMYLTAYKQTKELSLISTHDVVRLYYYVLEDEGKKESDRHRDSFNDHPGKKILDSLRRKLTAYRTAVVNAKVLVTLGDVGPFEISIFREKNGVWFADDGVAFSEPAVLTTLPSAPLSGAPILPTEICDVVRTFESPVAAGLMEKLAQCQHKVKIVVTALSKMGRWETPLIQAIRNGASVEMLLSHPACDFVKVRGTAIRSNLIEMVLDNRKALRDVQLTSQQEVDGSNQRGTLTVRLTSDFVSSSYCQLDDVIYFGVFWSRSGAIDGPLFEVRKGSATDAFLARQYDEMWGNAYADELSDTLPSPSPDDRRFYVISPTTS
jgi:hypothetical protein